MARIVLLEPDRQLAEKMKLYFNRAGHDLHYFADPQRAVTATDSSRPAIVILNLFLASRSGIEFLYELRSYPEWSDIPVIATGNLSSEELKEYRPAFQELQVTDYLPLQTTRLRDLLMAVQAALFAPKSIR